MDYNWELLKKYRFHLFGLAAIWIFFRHTIHIASFSYIEPFYFLFSWGDCGVDVFLVLSGFGLFHSLEKNCDLKIYFRKRLRRIAPTVLLFLIITSIILQDVRALNPLHDIKIIFYQYWYVCMCLFCYTIAFAIFKYFRNNLVVLFVLVEFLSILFIAAMRFLGKETHMFDVYVARVPCFVMGMLLAHFSKQHRSSYLKAVGGGALILGIVLMYLIPMEYKDFRRLIYILPSLGVCVTFPLFLNFLSEKIISCLAFIGKISLEFYLIHAFIMVQYFIEIYNKVQSQTQAFFIVALATIIFSLASKKITDYVGKFI